jgi:ketosteroid isomerase-like protein
MKRRTFLGSAAALAFSAAPTNASNARSGDVHGAKQFIIDWYAAFGNPKTNKEQYLSFTTPDYLLLENGALLDRNGDLALFLEEPPDLVRRDTFDFRRVSFAGERAFLVYFLESQITDSKNGSRHRRYLESAILRKSAGRWRAELLHSTRVQSASG